MERRFPSQRDRRSPYRFVNFIQNHDQIENAATGQRVHLLSNPGSYRAMTALLLLLPSTPMLFQGQEFASPTPFRYFSDHKPGISKLVPKGRADFLSQFRDLRILQARFHRARAECCHLFAHQDLLHLRRTDAVFADPKRGALDGAVLAPEAFLLRFFERRSQARRSLVDREPGSDMYLTSTPEPLLASPSGAEWENVLNTDDQR